jgi:FKBP-type peptidyl-prolyl cis-trans isomerase (trigger factor)
MSGLSQEAAVCRAIEIGAPTVEGLSRRIAARLPMAALTASVDARLDALAPAAADRAMAGETAVGAVRRLFGAQVTADILHGALAEPAASLPARLGLRAAAQPRAGELSRDVEGDIRVEFTFDVAPSIDLRAPASIDSVETLIAEPGEAEVTAALRDSAEQRATLEPLGVERAARRGEVAICGIDAAQPSNLIGNPAAAGAVPGNPGIPPEYWEPAVTEGMTLTILGTDHEGGIPCLDVHVTGEPPGKGTIVVFFERPNACPARQDAAFVFSAHWRLLAGGLPPRVVCEAFLNQRLATAFLKQVSARVPPPGFSGLAAQALRADLTLTAGPDVTHVRPGLLIRFAPGTTGPIDMTLRIGLPRLVASEDEGALRPFPEGSATDAAIEVGGADVLPGLAEELDSIRVGETRTIAAFLPLRDAPPGLAGREVRFAVTAKALRRRVVPPIDDALARALGHTDLAALREATRARLRQAYAALSERRLRADLLARIAERADFPLPESWVAAEAARLRQRRLHEGGGARPIHPKASPGALAERRVRIGLILAEVARAEGVTVPDSALTAAMRREAARWPGREAEVLAHLRANRDSAEALRQPLLEARVIDLLLARVRVEDRRVTPAELLDWDDKDT